MAVSEEASPICRGKNLSWDTVLLFFNYMPKEPMPKDQFNSYIENNISSWTQTHSQIARQLAFYYEDNGICYPRFDDTWSLSDLFNYMVHWAHNYFVPNPYSPSLKGKTPTSIYSHIVKCIENGIIDFDTALDSLFNMPLSSHDKVKVYLQNFTNIKFNQGVISLNQNLIDDSHIFEPTVEAANNPKQYFLYYSKGSTTLVRETSIKENNNQSPQQIFYGAPGTGKSHTVNELTIGESVIRTTFHPDSDYSTFVGAYKPTMKMMPITDESGKTITIGNTTLQKEQIVYEFVEQAFLQAYIQAWKYYAEQGNDTKKQYLIIEEINRGNCAQIFGDIFQLLDRNKEGFSVYPIHANKDIKACLEKQFKDLNLENLPWTNEYYDRDIAADIKSGDILVLPSNLYIWATMNTSDQSLFPIDSAFKRRWDWEYEPIKYKNTDWVIDINGIQYSWTSFQKEVNERIFEATNSEDKMLGDFFVKPHNNVISEKLLLNKILFYLWNDVCKDGDGDIFKTSDGMDIKFSDLYGKNGISLLISMMRHLGVALLTESVGGNEEIYDVEDDEYNEDVVNEENTYKNSKGIYSINGRGNYNQSHLCTQLVKSFIESNSQMSADEVVNQWRRLGNIGPHFIETQAIYDLRTDKNKYAVNTLQCNGDTIYLATNIWDRRRIDLLIKLLPKEWNLNVNRLS